MKVDCALLLLAALDIVLGHAVNQTGTLPIAKAPLPAGSGSPLKARNEPLYPAHNSTEPPCPTGTTSPMRWIRRHLALGSVTPEYRQGSSPTAPPAPAGTGSYGGPFRFVRSLGKQGSKEKRNEAYYAASNSSTPCPTGTSTPNRYGKRALVPLHPRHNLTVPDGPTGTGHRAVQRSHVPDSFENSTVPVHQISDGQIQAAKMTVVPVSQKSDGQIEGPTSSTSSATLVPTGIRSSSHSSSIPISAESHGHQIYPPYPTVNSTSVHPYSSKAVPTGGFTSYHTPKAPGSSMTYSNNTSSATSPEVTSTEAHHMSTGGATEHSAVPLTTGGNGAVRVSQPIVSTAVASVVSQISDGQVQAPATLSSVTITLPSYAAKATSIVVPASVATSISSIATASGYSVAQSIASTAMASLISQIEDGQVQAPATKGSPVSQITDGQVQIGATTHAATSVKASTTTEVHSGSAVSQITDGQIQAPGTSLVGTPIKASSTSIAHGVSQMTDGQVQAPATKSLASPVSQISDGQVQAPTSKETATPVSQISDSKVQAPKSVTTAALVSQKSDGQVQAPTSKASATPASQISDGQVQAPPTSKTAAATPVSQISDGQVQAPPTSKTTVASVSEKTDGQVEAPTGSTSTASSPVSQVSDGQLQVPPSSGPSPATPTPSVETTTLPAPPAPPAQVYTETQTSWYGYPETPSPTAQPSSSSTTDTTAPTVPPGIASEPMRGEAGKTKNGEGKGQAMFALVVMGAYLVMT
ncbi:MAG: hypothetical protein LQ352_002398 [Teloschistes flavicans]|nr:MAG: hypothetical protein LQ352_002398 [Teloschistes flavicans]